MRSISTPRTSSSLRRTLSRNPRWLAYQSEAAQPPHLHELSEQELSDIIVGNGIYCSRGIDTTSETSAIKAAIKARQRFRMISLEDLPDDWVAVSEFGVGGGGAWPEVRERYKGVDLSAQRTPQSRKPC